MKTYPSISRNFVEFEAYVFDKLDGSNTRFEWTKKKGWYKFGTRHRLFDETDPVFGTAIPLFHNTWAQALADIAKKERYEEMTVFLEFWGPNSFAGNHNPADQKTLTLFDVAPYKQGLLGPKDFLKLFGHLDIAKFLGRHHWTRGFVDRIYDGASGLEHGFEGVIGKSKEGRHDLIMRKAKSKQWIDKVKSQYSAEEAEKLINS